MKNNVLLSIIVASLLSVSCEVEPPAWSSYLLLSEYVSDTLLVSRHESMDIHGFEIECRGHSMHNPDYLYKEGKRFEAIRSFCEAKIEHLPITERVYPTVTIAGSLRITSSSSLFGEVPGSNLIEYFYASPENTSKMILEGPNFDVVYPLGSLKPSSIDEYLYPGSVFMSALFYLKKMPTTDVDYVELNIELPVEDTYYLDAFDEGGNFDESKVTKRTRTLTKTTHFKFK